MIMWPEHVNVGTETLMSDDNIEDSNNEVEVFLNLKKAKTQKEATIIQIRDPLAKLSSISLIPSDLSVMKFDVFVSFRGIDTRRTFVSHLLLALFKEQFKTFRQEKEEIPWNQPASSQVLEAIENSKIAIVVMSKNYTASVSCLDELAKIVECREKESLVMIPVLYEVDPSDVLTQARNLGELSDGDNNNNFEKVERWRNALDSLMDIYQELYYLWEDRDSSEDTDTDAFIIIRAMHHISQLLRPPLDKKNQDVKKPDERVPSDTTGFVTEGIDLVRDALRKIARRIMYVETLTSVVEPRHARSSEYVQRDEYVNANELSQLVPSIDFDSLVGMDRQMKAVDALLLSMDSEDDGLGEMGICGEERLGKTTLARCVYEKISPQFQDHYYFEDETPNSSQGIGSTCLLEEIARAGISAKKLDRPGEVVELQSQRVVNENLGHRKVLLIVDTPHLYHTGQLDYIRNIARLFGPGSRLICVTRYDRVLLQCGVKNLYEVETLRYNEALQLFSQYAFKQEHVPREYYRLSVRAVLMTGRIPLSLKVFGSFLRGKTVSEWEFEICRLQASQDNCVARVSSYIGNAFS